MDVNGKFGLYLVTAGLVAEGALRRAHRLQEQYPFLKIGEILVHQGALDFGVLVEALKDYRAQCKLGQLLVLEGAITTLQLEEALTIQATTGLLLGKVLIDMKACTFDQVMVALSHQRRALLAA